LTLGHDSSFRRMIPQSAPGGTVGSLLARARPVCSLPYTPSSPRAGHRAAKARSTRCKDVSARRGNGAFARHVTTLVLRRPRADDRARPLENS
jgi:hypothetical protein